MSRHFIFLVLIFIADHAFAGRGLEFAIHQPYISTRAIGMGNAFAAVADDSSAIFYNPAALAFRTKGELNMFIRAEADVKTQGLMKDMQDAN